MLAMRWPTSITRKPTPKLTALEADLVEGVERRVPPEERLLTAGRLEREATLGFRPNSDGAFHISAERGADL